MSPPRVLWLSPWTRPAVRVQSEALIRHGADVLLVTSDRHPESDTARDYELVLEPRFLTAATWPPTLKAWRQVRKFRPDVVIAEQVRDPRWIALAGRTPRIQVIHDDRPHDPVEALPSYELAVLDRWGARSAATITYSHYVAGAVAARRDVAGTPIHVVPLASDLDVYRVPSFVPADGRRNFVMFGRLNPYKNADVVLQAWQRHVAGGGWRGDDLVLIGGERWTPTACRNTHSGAAAVTAIPMWSPRWPRPRVRSRTIGAPRKAACRCFPCTWASCRSFRRWAAHRSTSPGLPPIGVDDVAGLAAAFDMLADPAAAARQGATAARHYQTHCAVDLVAERFLDVIAEVMTGRG